MPTILDGKALSKKLNQALHQAIVGWSRPPGLAVVLVGQDPASKIYVGRKSEVAHRLGFLHRQIDLPADVREDELVRIVRELGDDAAIDGILVQAPLPKHIDAARVTEAIDPAKDVDGFTTTSTGLLSQGRPHLVACTPFGVMKLLEEAAIDLGGKHAVVVGRSNIVGRPMAMLLEQANATVTVCHSRTTDLGAHLHRADVIVAAVGRADTVRAAHVREGAVVIDVGMNRLPDGRVVGDVAYDEVAAKASAITPVPGGVGPMTIAMLMHNTVKAAQARGGH